jgi:hypothetical protein
MDQDDQYIRLLSIFHYVVAGLAALFSLIPVVHLTLGIAMVSGAFKEPRDPFPFSIMGWFFIVFASCFILCGLAFSTCLALAGRYLSRRRHYYFCFVMAALACMFMPFGTVLGVFTIILLTRDSVKAQFQSWATDPNHKTDRAPSPQDA